MSGGENPFGLGSSQSSSNQPSSLNLQGGDPTRQSTTPNMDASDDGLGGLGTTAALIGGGVLVAKTRMGRQMVLDPAKKAMLTAKARSAGAFRTTGTPSTATPVSATSTATPTASAAGTPEAASSPKTVPTASATKTMPLPESSTPEGATAKRRVLDEVSKSAAKKSAGQSSAEVASKALRMGRIARMGIAGFGAAGVVLWLVDADGRKEVKGLIEKLAGTRTPSIDTPPSPPDTYFLPLTWDGNRDEVIRRKDADLVALNDAMFAFDPNKVWHPTAPEIETTPQFSSTATTVTGLAGQTNDILDQINRTLRAFPDEQYVAQAAEGTRDTRKSLTDVSEGIVVPMGTSIADIQRAVNRLYQDGLRAANLRSRQEIANSSSGIWPWDFSVDESKMGETTAAIDAYTKTVKASLDTLDAAVNSWMPAKTQNPAPSNVQNKAQPQGKTKDQNQSRTDNTTSNDQQKNQPFTAVPTNTPQPSSIAKPGTPGATTNTPSVKATPVTTANPFGQQQQTPTQQQSPFNTLGNQLGSQLGNLGNQGASLGERQLASLLGNAQQQKKNNDTSTLGDKDKKDDPKSAAKKDATAKPTGVGADKSAAAPGGGKSPSAHPAGHDPSGKDPTGKDPSGRDDKPAGDNRGDGAQSKTVKIDGKETTFSDPRTAKMATLMNPTDGSAPPTVEKAAADAGLKIGAPGQDLGDRVSPQGLRPGDIVVGADHKGMYLGESKVLVDGQIRPLGDVAKFTGNHQGFFRLDGDAVTPTAHNVPVGDHGGQQPQPSGGPSSAHPVSGDTGQRPGVGNPTAPADNAGQAQPGSQHKPPPSSSGPASRIPTGD